MKKTHSLSFGLGNAKFGQRTTFSLPAGYCCPGANECLSRAKRDTGILSDGTQTRFRCFAATMESRLPSVRKSRWDNLEALRLVKTPAAMVSLILGSLPETPLCRVHVSGDFFSQTYFLAWMDVARARPNTTFYAYTKSLKIWVDNADTVPSNFKLTASKGGRWDSLIGTHNLKYAEVVFSPEQADALGLEIDHDDSHAFGSDKSFALLLHATQPKGSEAARALSALKARGIKGYSAQAA